MPKEVIYGGPNIEGDSGQPVVEVRWSRETGHIQLVTKTQEKFSGSRLVNGEAIHYTDGFYVDLDRRGINDLIRQLRRARDQALGRDE